MHKAMLPLAGKAVISHIIEKFPVRMPVVIAVGHLADQITHYIRLAHPERDLRFVEVPDYDGAGSGPGASLERCASVVSGSFYLTTVDTVILDQVPAGEDDWIGIAPVASNSAYCTVGVTRGNEVHTLFEKGHHNATRLAYIGLAHIKSIDIFWRSLRQTALVAGAERQVTPGLQALAQAGVLKGIEMAWLDTGKEEGYLSARKYFEGEAFDFSKESECT